MPPPWRAVALALGLAAPGATGGPAAELGHGGATASTGGAAAGGGAAGEVTPLSEAGVRLLSLLSDINREGAWESFEGNLSLLALAFSEQGALPTPEGTVSSVHLRPRAIVLDDFLTSDECDFLRAFASDKLQPAMVVKTEDEWYDTQTQVRNNDQYWTNAEEEKSVPMLRHINKRIHRVARVPDEYAEALQIGRYYPNQKYEQHLDSDPINHVARPMTLITYLSDVEEGGDTLFPLGRRDCSSTYHKHPETGEQIYGAYLCCASPEKDAPETLRVRAKKGRAVLFHNHFPDGTRDPDSLHIGCPVVKGEKWIAQRWLRYEPYDRVSYHLPDVGRDPRFDGAPEAEHEGPHEGAAPARCRPEGGQRLRMVSNSEPRAYLQECFLSEGELEPLRALLVPRLGPRAGPSDVADVLLGSGDVSQVPALHGITERVRVLARLHGVGNASQAPLAGLRVQELSAGALVEPALDSEPPNATQPVTVVVFLSAPAQGGEIIFPSQGSRGPGQRKARPVSEECREAAGLSVRPVAGGALLLFSHGMGGQLDPTSARGVCPVGLGGTLLLATWQFRFDLLPTPGKKAESAPKSIRVHFENQRDLPVNIFWVEVGTGKETPMGKVEPAGSSKLTSYVGHMFRVRDQDGALIQAHRVGKDGLQTVTIDHPRREL